MGRSADMTPPLRWRLGVAGGVALAVLLVDQLTKLAVRAVGDTLHVTVIPGVIDFLFVRNIGARLPNGAALTASAANKANTIKFAVRPSISAGTKPR